MIDADSTSPPSPSPERAAVAYAAAGWAVFPQKVDRGAFVRWGELAGAPSEETVRRWWARWPEANVGCAAGPSGLVVVDADGELGEVALEALAEAFGPWPTTLATRTGGGGLHLIYRDPRGLRGGRPGALIAGVDVKAGGGCFTLPPSVHHRTGRPYTFERLAPPNLAPVWLCDRLQALEAERQERLRARMSGPVRPSRPAPGWTDPRGSAYGLAALEGIIGRLLTARHPGRRDALNEAALHLGHLVAGDELAESHALAELTEAGHELFSEGPPPEAREVEVTVRNGLADGAKTPRRAPEREPARRGTVGAPGGRPPGPPYVRPRRP